MPHSSFSAGFDPCRRQTRRATAGARQGPALPIVRSLLEPMLPTNILQSLQGTSLLSSSKALCWTASNSTAQGPACLIRWSQCHHHLASLFPHPCRDEWHLARLCVTGDRDTRAAAEKSPAPAALPGLSQSKTSTADNKPLISGRRQGGEQLLAWGSSLPGRHTTRKHQGHQPASTLHGRLPVLPPGEQDSPASRLLHRSQHFGSDFFSLSFDSRLHRIQEEAGNSLFVQQLPGKKQPAG